MLSIDDVRSDDLPATAALHKAHLRLGLFPRLGRNFLCQYQETFARSPFGIALVAHDDDRVVGALFGTTSNAEHYRWVVRHCGWELAIAGCGAMLLRPQLAWTFASTRVSRYARGLRRYATDDGPPAGEAAPLSVLSHIVTADSHRHRGIGRRLVERFRELAGAEGAHSAMLVTEEGGEGIPFFERIGCVCVGNRPGPDGSTVREYRLMLDEDELHETDHARRDPADARRFRERLGSADTRDPARAGIH